MKFESKLCLWCWQSVPFDPARIVSDRYGTAVLRGKDGRMHSFRSKLKDENNEQETEQVGRVLFELNQARREIERSIYMDVEAQILEKKIDKNI